MKSLNITIDSNLKQLCGSPALGVLFYEADVCDSNEELLNEFNNRLSELSSRYSMEDIVQIPHISATRNAYKTLGKSPSEYRNAAEAMLRRIVKQNGLYHINNIVEINNYISVSSGYSIGSYDLECLNGAISWKAAPADTHYEGIGKSSINIGCIPTLYDELGPFGNPTSDSQRAMIKTGHHQIMSVIYSFDGTADLKVWMDNYKELLNRLCNVGDISSEIFE